MIPLIPPKKNVNSEAEAKIDSENSYIKSEPDDGLKPPKTADELAAEQIIAELNNKASVRNEGPQLVIAQTEALSSKSKKGQPLLLANQAPELLGLSDDNERFKVDINLRADDVDFKSDIYKAIPIEKFGEAMLRLLSYHIISYHIFKKKADVLIAYYLYYHTQGYGLGRAGGRRKNHGR